MAKTTNKKIARSVSAGSRNSKSSTATNRASNRSSSSSPPPLEISGVASRKSKKKSSARKRTTSKTPKIPPKSAPKTPEPTRKRAQTAPVDLDNMSDNLHTNHHQDAISPADTFDTIPLSASSSSSRSTSSSLHKSRSDARDDGSNDYLPVSLLNFDSPKNEQRRSNGDGNKSKIVIELKDSNDSNKNGRSKSVIGGGGSLFCLLKPLLLLLLLVALGSGGASVYGWLFRFPSLNKQVKELEDQVNRLNLEVDRLETENDRYETLNDRLNITVDDLEGVRDDLNGTVFELEGVADALNTTKDQIVDQIEQLKGQNEEYASLNENLQDSVMLLDQEVDFFREALQELSDEHSVLRNTTTALQDLAVSFSNTTIDQNETLQVLKDTLEGFQGENDRLEEFNKNLETALIFLNDTLFSNGNLVESSRATLGEITEDLGERVLEQQGLTLLQLQISYRQLLAGWDCDYRDVFRSEPFGQDYNLPIPTDDGNLLPPEVETYIEERVLSKMCLDPEDFLAYLSSPASGELTSNTLIRAVTLYTEDAMQYYFPDNADGITLLAWTNASYRCELLESPFVSSQRRRQLYHLRQGRWH